MRAISPIGEPTKIVGRPAAATPPNYFGETGNNDVLEFSYTWTFGKV
jgi:hypothetical protein